MENSVDSLNVKSIGLSKFVKHCEKLCCSHNLDSCENSIPVEITFVSSLLLSIEDSCLVGSPCYFKLSNGSTIRDHNHSENLIISIANMLLGEHIVSEEILCSQQFYRWLEIFLENYALSSSSTIQQQPQQQQQSQQQQQPQYNFRMTTNVPVTNNSVNSGNPWSSSSFASVARVSAKCSLCSFSIALNVWNISESVLSFTFVRESSFISGKVITSVRDMKRQKERNEYLEKENASSLSSLSSIDSVVAIKKHSKPVSNSFSTVEEDFISISNKQQFFEVTVCKASQLVESLKNIVNNWV